MKRFAAIVMVMVLLLLQTTVAFATAVVELPSKTASDTTTVVEYVSESGTPLEDDFELLVVEENEIIQNELAMIRNHVIDQGRPVCTWLPEDTQDEIQQQLDDDVEMENLVVYDIVPVITRNYKDAYGNVICTMSFATPYPEGHQIVAVLGLPKQEETVDSETQMDWIVQTARVNADGNVEIVFKQEALIGMGEQIGMLMLLAEPLAE